METILRIYEEVIMPIGGLVWVLTWVVLLVWAWWRQAIKGVDYDDYK